ncbi:MAG: hypothetical protein ACPKQO_01915, partial [Nitrososphaeraceae archaeon]
VARKARSNYVFNYIMPNLVAKLQGEGYGFQALDLIKKKPGDSSSNLLRATLKISITVLYKNFLNAIFNFMYI